MAEGATRYRDNVEQHGMSSTHHQVIAWVPPNARVLEVGCATGYVGRVLRDQKGCEVSGLEVDAEAARAAREGGLTVLEGSLEDPAFRASVRGPFDVVIAADVLEHLADPGPVLEHFKRWLAPGGFVIIAVPNIATWSMRVRLFFHGDFEYAETGILDRTHLHHFTWRTLHKLVASQGWTVAETMVDGWEIPFLQTALVTAPSLVIDRTLGWETERTWARRAARRRALHAASRAYLFGERLGKGLIRRFPNIAAPHVALLLFPPEAAAG
jgi:methionine biosynthesis protein MetW